MRFEETNYETLRAKYDKPSSVESLKEETVEKTVPAPAEMPVPKENEPLPPNPVNPLPETAGESAPAEKAEVAPAADAPTEKPLNDAAPAENEPVQPDAPQSFAPAAEPRETDMNLSQIVKMLNEQNAAIAVMNQRLSALTNAFVKMQQLPAQVEDLSKAAARQEKANVDILRDSKNYQAAVQAQMQRELEGYRKLHADTAYAPLLMEIANLYVSAERTIAFIQDQKLKNQLTEMLLENMEEFLEDQGVVIHTTPVGEKRSLKTCKTRKTVPTANKELHGLVAASNNPSFEFHNLVLIKESVDTYIYDETLDTAPAQPAESIPSENTDETVNSAPETAPAADVHQEETL